MVIYGSNLALNLLLANYYFNTSAWLRTPGPTACLKCSIIAYGNYKFLL